MLGCEYSVLVNVRPSEVVRSPFFGESFLKVTDFCMCDLKSPLLCLFDIFVADLGLGANAFGASDASIYFVISSSVLPSIVLLLATACVVSPCSGSYVSRCDDDAFSSLAPSGGSRLRMCLGAALIADGGAGGVIRRYDSTCARSLTCLKPSVSEGWDITFDSESSVSVYISASAVSTGPFSSLANLLAFSCNMASFVL